MSDYSSNAPHQKSTFNKLVDEGIYDKDFKHAEYTQVFVNQVIDNHVIQNLTSNNCKIIDCGCGTGAWLHSINNLFSEKKLNFQLFGFDLSDKMVKVAQKHLMENSISANLKQGDLLNIDSFHYTNMESKFDFIFTYDTIQQLPPKSQYDACKLLVKNLAPGGILIIFDHDSKSKYGQQMARKKFFTQYFGLKLVPRYYCNAKYPPLAEFSEKLINDLNVTTKIAIAPDQKKRALIITSTKG